MQTPKRVLSLSYFRLSEITTHRLAALEVGDSIENVLGPLGQPTEIKNYGKVVCVGGGIGVAPLHPIAQALKAAGNEVKIIIGSRNRELLILEEEMGRIADELIICTDDGFLRQKSPCDRTAEGTV